MTNYGTIAVCPYFVLEDPLRIKCEGIIQLNEAATEYVMRFPSSNQKKEWLKGYCETHQYKNCPYAEILEQAYDDQGKSVRAIAKRRLELRAPVKRANKKVKSKGIKGQLTFKF